MQRFKIRVILGFVAFEILFQLLSRCLPYTYEAIFCLRSCADLWPWLCLGMLLKEHGWIRCFNLKWYLILALSVLWIFSYFINSAFSIKGYHYVVSISGVIFFTSLFCTLSNRCNFKMGGGNWKMYFADLCIALFPFSFFTTETYRGVFKGI